MSKKKEKPATLYENIKVPKSYVDKIRKHKDKTGVSIMAFTCQAIDEKLKSINQ